MSKSDKTNKSDRSVIYESGFTGHRSEYIAHLMRFINSQPELHGKFVFVLNEQIRELIGELSTSPSYCIKFLKLNKEHKNSITRSFWEWQLIAEVIKKQKSIYEIIFMEIDPYLALLCTNRFKKFDLSVKGILFQPYIHFKEVKERDFSIFKQFLKNYIFQKLSILLNSNIKKLFVLNDKRTVDIMNKRIKHVFFNLPDPIVNDIKNVDSNILKNVADKYAIKNFKKNLLLFGSIDYRKNLINIINSIKLLPIEVKKDVHLIVAGKFSTEVREKYLKHIDTNKDEISIAYNDSFVNGAEREPLFQSCDLVLMPYINFYSASSVLGHAISHNKNVIVSKKGLIGRIVKEHNLGIAVDPLNAEEIKEAISKLLSDAKEFRYDCSMLIEEYSPHSFSKAILLN
ncbi:MAG: glycosyltransferase [Chitinophagaceae bacterium]|nr:glycosyltransferase [Chitinophagaceae bacterium]